jgi:hypothetical protein
LADGLSKNGTKNHHHHRCQERRIVFSPILFPDLFVFQKQKELGLPNSDFDYKMDKRDQYLKQLAKGMK